MSGYEALNYSGKPLNFPTSMATALNGWGPGVGPAAPQVAAYNPMSYVDTMSRFGSSSPQLSFGDSFTNSSSEPNVGGGYAAMDSTGLGGRPFNASNPDVPAVTNTTGIDGTTPSWSLGGALDTFKTLASVVGTFGQIYSGIQMNKIAKQQLAFSKESYAENLKNQKKAYNNSSEARSRSAGVQNNWSDAEVSAHIAKRAM